MTEIWLLYSTFPNAEEAFSVARELLAKRQIACANVYNGIVSLYHWQGKLQREKEAVMIAKTTKEAVSQAIDAIEKLHSYDVPCVVAFPLAAGHLPFMDWVAQETTNKA